jgi:hypothetical protein
VKIIYRNVGSDTWNTMFRVSLSPGVNAEWENPLSIHDLNHPVYKFRIFFTDNNTLYLNGKSEIQIPGLGFQTINPVVHITESKLQQVCYVGFQEKFPDYKINDPLPMIIDKQTLEKWNQLPAHTMTSHEREFQKYLGSDSLRKVLQKEEAVLMDYATENKKRHLF